MVYSNESRHEHSSRFPRRKSFSELGGSGQANTSTIHGGLSVADRRRGGSSKRRIVASSLVRSVGSCGGKGSMRLTWRTGARHVTREASRDCLRKDAAPSRRPRTRYWGRSENWKPRSPGSNANSIKPARSWMCRKKLPGCWASASRTGRTCERCQGTLAAGRGCPGLSCPGRVSRDLLSPNEREDRATAAP